MIPSSVLLNTPFISSSASQVLTSRSLSPVKRAICSTLGLIPLTSRWPYLCASCMRPRRSTQNERAWRRHIRSVGSARQSDGYHFIQG